MKYLKTYESLESMTIVSQVRKQEYDLIEMGLKNKTFDINLTVGSMVKIPLITAVNDIGMLELLTKYGVDWYKRDSRGKDFIDRLEEGSMEHQIKLLKYIKWKYPDRYKKHNITKETDKYNL